MSKKLFARISVLGLFLAASGLILVSTPAKAGNGAGHLDGTCFNTLTTSPESTYVGKLQLVANHGGKINAHCNADLVDGPGVTTTVHSQGNGNFDGILLTCDFVITPSGHANANCHN